MIKKLTANTYYMPHVNDTDRPVLGLISGKKHSLIIDSGNSPAHARDFLKQTGELDIPPVSYLVLTHYHWDHVFGIEEMNIPTFSSEKTKLELSRMKNLKWDDEALGEHVKKNIISSNCSRCIKEELIDRENFKSGSVDVGFNNFMSIDLGGLTCNLYAVGGTHTDDSTIIHIPEERVLFLGDCIYGRRFNGLYGYDRDSLFSMLKQIEDCESDHFIVSHEPIWTKKDLFGFRDLLKKGADIAGEGACLEEALERYRKEYGGEPSEDEVFSIECFVNYNKAFSD